MRHRQAHFMAGLASFLLLVACTSGGRGADDATTATEPPSAVPIPTTTTQLAEDLELVVWADAMHAPALQAAARAFEGASGTAVEVEVMSFFDIRAAVLDAVPTGEGPDLFIDSNEGTGALVEAGVLAVLDLGGRAAEFLPVAIDAFSYAGHVYALPFAIEAVGLYFNRDLVEEAPSDFEALRAACDDLGYPTADGLPCLAIPAGEPLHQFPFVAGFGGYVFGFENGAYDVSDVGLDSPGAIEGAAFLDDLYRDGYADGALDYDFMADLFNNGAVPFMVTGPWQIEAVEAAGIRFGVAKLPLMDGRDPRPLVGAQGVFVNGLSAHTELAMQFLVEHVAGTETMLQLSEVTRRPSALRSALGEVTEDAAVVAFAESAIGGLPLPNIPEMEVVWDPLGEALAAISRGDYGEEIADPAAAMERSAGRVRAVLGTG